MKYIYYIYNIIEKYYPIAIVIFIIVIMLLIVFGGLYQMDLNNLRDLKMKGK